MNTEESKPWPASLPFISHDETPFLRGFLYGEFGTWKTVTACSCSTGNIILVTADDGWVSLKNHPDIFERVRVIKYQGLSQLRLISEQEPPDLMVIDTVSQIQEAYVDFLMDNVTWAGNYREKTVPNRGSKVLPEEIPGFPDYHLARNKLRGPLRKIMNMQCDVIFTSHLREPSFIEQQKGKLLRRPSVTQKLFEFVARESHFIGFMEKKQGKSATISFRTDPKTIAKSRLGNLDDQIIYANQLPKYLEEWKNF